MDPHQNLFFYYAGQRRKGTDRERQIEDNSTKALVNTLELSEGRDGPHALVKPLLEWLGIDWVEGRVRFALQRATIPKNILDRATVKVLLGIAPYLPQNVQEKPDDKESSRPDAWIWGRDFVVCIETKTVGTFDEGQLKRHLRTLGPQAKRREHTWRDIYGVLEKQLSRLERSKHHTTHLLLSELVGYLDIIAYRQGIPMGEFTGFKQEHFDAFVRLDPEEEEDNRRRVKHYLGLFTEDLTKDPPAALAPFDKLTLGNVKVKDRAAWATLSRLDRPVQEPHFSFAIGPDAFIITLLMEGKRPTTAALRSIQADPGGFLAALARLGKKEQAGYSVLVMRRRQVQAMLYRSEPVLELHVSHIRMGDIDYLVQKLNEIRSDKSESASGGLFELHIRRTYYRDDASLASAEFVGHTRRVMVGLAELDGFLAAK